jgi:hypothetical protein
MKDQLITLGWSLLGLSILPIAKLAVSGLMLIVNKSPRKEDNDFLVALANDILKQRKDGKL